MVCRATTKAESISVLTDRDALKHAIAVPKTRLTARSIATRLIRRKRSDIVGPNLPSTDVLRFKMSRRKVDSYPGDFDGNSLCLDREEFPIKLGKSDLVRAVRLRPNGRRETDTIGGGNARAPAHRYDSRRGSRTVAWP